MNRSAAGLAAAFLTLALPAAAQTVRDEATGVSVTPPAGYTATLVPPQPGPRRSVFDIRGPGDTDTGCRVTATPSSQYAGLTQEQINDRNTHPTHLDLVEASLGGLYEVRELGSVGLGAIAGIAAVLDSKPRPDLPARALEIRALLVMIETPRLRVTLRCIAEKAEFQARRLEFRGVFEGIALP
ncbi:hypothetical protein [Elioraea rosea]|uniref:hypothetical protein n=1 Tax=Elioraea rosea TaxID=2492390 RepID=UPI001182044E|nr:hypothetical protein [Elioraea rosea]